MSLKDLNKQRGTIRQRLTLFENYLTPLLNVKQTNDVNNNELRLRLDKLRELSVCFDDIQSQIELLADDTNEQIMEREGTESKFFKLLAQGQALLQYFERNCKDEMSSSKSSTLRNLKLPPLSISPFNGDPRNWLSFRDLYLSLIHDNEQLDEISKFHYLKQYLRDEASKVIDSVTVTSDNYNIAWSLLCERFNNKRLLINEHIKCLFSIEPLHKESVAGIRNLIDSLSKNLSALKSLGEPTDKWDSLIIYMASAKLDNTTARMWEESRSDKDFVTLDNFNNFLRSRATVLETIKSSRSLTHYSHSEKRLSKSSSFLSSTDDSFSGKICVLCKENHKLHECQKFKALPMEEKFDVISQWNLCMNCLRGGHQSYQCRLNGCRFCKRKHNSLLHNHNLQTSQDSPQQDQTNNLPSTSSVPTSTAPTTDSGPPTTVSMSAVSVNQALLATALVQVTNNGKKYILRAILDSGSQSSFLTEKAVALIGCKKYKNNFQLVSGLGNSTFNVVEHCNILASSIHNNFSIYVKCYILPTISNQIPQVSINVQTLDIPNNIKLADPQFYQPSDIDLLLGADVFWNLMGPSRRNLGPQNPILQETLFGWIVAGPMGRNYYNVNSNLIQCNFSQEIREQLSRFWELEEVPKNIKPELQDNFCEKLFAETTRRECDGRFCVQLPLKESSEVLGDSYSIAEKRFFQLERKLKNKPDLKEQYKNFIHEYEILGHMSEVSKPEFGCYLPHHAVIRESSETTKLRVVFDGSCKTSSGFSFNDIQHVGPVVQDDLFSILLRYRQYTFAVSADIEKMYRQILIEPHQRHLQMILWRDEPNLPIKHFKLNTVTYGTASAPFLSTRCILQLSQESNNNKIANLLKENFYVDDFLAGADTEQELCFIVNSIVSILNSACLPLRKFRTNAAVNFDTNSTPNQSPKNLDMSSQSSVLGLKWNPVKDTLQFPVKIEFNPNVTKRSILSNSAKLFDPLGLLSLTTIIPKIMLQKLWLSKLGWDDAVDVKLQRDWYKFFTELDCLSDIEIPRCTIGRNATEIELHCFSDASEKAYAATIYIRSIDKEGRVLVRLLCAKTKVAPIKPTTIPRLELCGALLAARLSNKVSKALRCDIKATFHWTDSTIVLGWINSESHDMKQFVANRISEIKELTLLSSWRHVPGELNPADLASRGVSPKSIQSCTRWWEGPSFLRNEEIEWPENMKFKNNDNLPEMKTYTKNKSTISTSLHTKTTTCTISTPTLTECSIVKFERFSKLTTLQRSVAYALRFIHNLKNKKNKITGHLMVEELNSSLKLLIKQHQSECFSNELNLLNKNKNLPSASPILSLSPFLNDDKILSVGGRLQNSFEIYNKKHPILLDPHHIFTKLIFLHYHKKFLHCGPQLLLSNIRSEFWPIRGRVLARTTVNNCKICKILKAQVTHPIMGTLPAPRVTPSLPFQVSGVDFAGPFLITDRKGRGCKITKSYLCLFVCFATKALHLELVSDLTSNAFILSLKRFISRRGKPVDLYCDNGTNFVGANNEFVNFLKSSNDDVSGFAADEGINFKFSPAYSPHFGGIWESAVKSCKYHLTRTLGNQHLTYEELSTLLTQIEAILNSRPLTPLSSDPNDLEPLTPGHFLIGRKVTSLPSPCYVDINVHKLDRYQRLEQLKQEFWKRWRNEYLCELQQRTKWKIDRDGFHEGDLVVIKETNVPPLNWRMGRICKLYPGPDGVSRVADVSTVKGVVRRAVHNICSLLDSTTEDYNPRKTKVLEGGEDVKNSVNKTHRRTNR